MSTKHAITNINLKLIQAFLLVAESSSFRTAADATGRSKSAISAQIRQLESQMGVQLFRRTTRHVALTSEGEQLLTYVRRSMEELHLGLKQVRDTAQSRRTRVCFACSPLIAATYLPEILSSFSHAHPTVEVVVHEVGSDGLVASVRSGRSAFAIGDGAVGPELDFDVFLEDHACALIPRALCRTPGPDIPLRQVADFPLLMLNSSTPMRTLVEEALKGYSAVAEIRYEFTHTQTLIRMSEAGLGVSILPAYALPNVLKPSVRALRIVDPDIVRWIGIIRPRGQALSAPAAFLAELATRLMLRGSKSRGLDGPLAPTDMPALFPVDAPLFPPGPPSRLTA